MTELGIPYGTRPTPRPEHRRKATHRSPRRYFRAACLLYELLTESGLSWKTVMTASSVLNATRNARRYAKRIASAAARHYDKLPKTRKIVTRDQDDADESAGF